MHNKTEEINESCTMYKSERRLFNTRISFPIFFIYQSKHLTIANWIEGIQLNAEH